MFAILDLLTSGSKQATPHDFIDQVFGDLGYGYEEEPFREDGYSQEEAQEENQGKDEEESQEEESYIPQDDAEFFTHLQGGDQEANQDTHSGNHGEDSEGFNNTPTHGKQKQAGKIGSGQRVKARTDDKVSFFAILTHIVHTYL